MRTRRSPRNQDRLWKALGGAPPAKVARGRLPTKADVVAARWRPAPPFAVGDYVTADYRVDPFRIEEVLVVEELRNLGTIAKPRWRVRAVAANRAVSGWLDAETLTIYGGDRCDVCPSSES